MYKNKTIAVVVPAHNEESQILKVIRTMPKYVDEIVVIDDASDDQTVGVVRGEQDTCNRLHLITHSKNQGVGGSIASGYNWAKEHQIDVTGSHGRRWPDGSRGPGQNPRSGC